MLGPKGHRTSPCGDELQVLSPKAPMPEISHPAQGLQALPGLAVQLLHTGAAWWAGRKMFLSATVHERHAQLVFTSRLETAVDQEGNRALDRQLSAVHCAVPGVERGREWGPGHSGNPVRCIDQRSLRKVSSCQYRQGQPLTPKARGRETPAFLEPASERGEVLPL